MFFYINLLTLQKQFLLQYHHTSYVLFLYLVKSWVIINWNEVMSILLNLIENNFSIQISMNYMQKFYLYLHLLDLHCVNTLSHHYNCNEIAETIKDICDWRHMSLMICITLKILRTKLRVFTSLKSLKLNTLTVHCVVQFLQASATEQWQNLFAAIQLFFKEVTTTDISHSKAFKIHITEDKHEWNEKSSLLILFYCLTWILLQKSRTATVAFNI